MTIIEIILLVVGMVFILASFWVTEKLSPDELEHISQLSKEEMGVMLEHELDRSKNRLAEIVEDTIDASKEHTERSLEKQTNEKIMAINEYSDTVIEKMNKTHNEIMFLYSMLNDKHTELTDFTSSLSQQLQDLKAQEEEMTNYYISQIKSQKPQAIKTAEPVYQQAPASVQADRAQAPASAQPGGAQAPASAQPGGPQTGGQQAAEDNASGQGVAAQAEAGTEAGEEVNVRDEILRLYEEGRDSVAIAKKLGMGVGEVRLILGLYKGD